MVIVSDITTLKERGKYQGYLEAFIALGNGVGPLIGGVFSEKVDWRWTFWFVVPLAIAAAIVVILLLPKPTVEGDWRVKLKLVDYLGIFCSLAGVLFLLVSVPFIGTGR
jgi:MFS family permease